MSYITKLPFEGIFKITYPYGIKDNAYLSGYHQGIDMGNSQNPNVYSINTGVVTYAGWENINNKKQGFGLYVSVKFDVTSSGYKKVFYGHLNKINVSVGQNISNATILGIMGSTGFSTGPHTHVEIREYSNDGRILKIINPANYMGIENKIGTYDSANYRIYLDNNSGKQNNTNNESIGNYKITASIGVNFRESYTTYSKIILGIPKGTILNVTELYKGGIWTWGKTIYHGNEGWVAIKKNDNSEMYAIKV